ncbi:unnamed protein product [Penicillium olsonii]|nr:unnamed protein product [Penicillium olsonii]CAG7919706.1 unnamed protein product [Penicillium olsonii]
MLSSADVPGQEEHAGASAPQGAVEPLASFTEQVEEGHVPPGSGTARMGSRSPPHSPAPASKFHPTPPPVRVV